ncbi:DUF4837 family protein [bacterium]|nr:DUF4837 family protein [bacterium]
MKSKAIIFCMFFILFTLACDVKKEAVGSYNKIYTLVDAEELGNISPLLSSAVEIPIVTPRNETIFKLEYVDETTFEKLTHARTSIIAASLESPGPAGRFIREALSEDAKKMVLSGSDWIIAKKDLWASGQLTIIITAPTEKDLESRLFLGGDDLFRLLNNSVNDRISYWLFGKVFGESEQISLEDSIASEYGYAIRVPRFWTWEKGTPDKRFIWLRTLEPERWVFVWWTALDSSLDFSIDRWMSVRDSLCAIYYEGDIVSLEMEPESMGVYIGGRPAVQIRALWENPVKTMGGPIISYVFSEPITNRLYIVDGSLFAPIVKKEPYLRHVEIVCKSFRGDVQNFYEERENRSK